MSAVVGGDRDAVLTAIGESGAVVASVNSASQVVAAGTLEQLGLLADAARSRVIPLRVAAPSTPPTWRAHRRWSASRPARIVPGDPTVPLLSNRDGEAVTGGQDALDRIVSQMTSPVRWDLCSARLAADGVTGIVELCPGGVLTGLAKRELRGVPAVALNSPTTSRTARAVAEHA